MSPQLRITTALVIIGVAAALLWFRPGSRPARSDDHDQQVESPSRTSPHTGTGNASAPGDLSRVDPTNTDPRFTRFTDGTVHLTSSITAGNNLHQSAEPGSDLEIIDQLIADYRLIYRENPVGTENAEIVAQLLGNNPKKVFFLDPKLAALTTDGELLDRWGSPYIFHPLRADLMDIRSIGPDKKPWTQDDLTLGLEDAEAELQLHP